MRLHVSGLRDVLLEHLLVGGRDLVSRESGSAWSVVRSVVLEARPHVYIIGYELGVDHFVDFDFFDVEHIAVGVTWVNGDILRPRFGEFWD